LLQTGTLEKQLSLNGFYNPDGAYPPNDHTIIREGGGDSKEVEEVQGVARNKLK